jgi:magnesium chelatase family protein
MNPCPCGYFGDPRRECRCSQTQIQNYRNKISGPLLDRIDIHIEVPSVRYQELSSLARGETSAAIRGRVMATRQAQRDRFRGLRKLHSNAGMGSRQIQKYCTLEPDAQEVLKMAISDLNFSARAYDRILKVARTIADIEGSATICTHHVAEAIQYRTLDRNLWR